MTQALLDPIATPKKVKKPKGFIRNFFRSTDTDEEDYSDLSKSIVLTQNIILRTTSYLNHLLKDNQFMVNLSSDDVAKTMADIGYLKSSHSSLLVNLEQLIEDGMIDDSNKSIEMLEDVNADLISYYLDSVSRLTTLINRRFLDLNDKQERSLNDYNFIELLAEVYQKKKSIAESKNTCRNTLKLRAGETFGYNLRIDIKGVFADTSAVTDVVTNRQDYDFFYPVNYAMIMDGRMLPDMKLIKDHLLRIPSLNANKIISIDILNDPIDEVEKILQITDVLRNELHGSMESVSDAESFLKISINDFIERGRTESSEIIVTISEKLRQLDSKIKEQSERLSHTEDTMASQYPDISTKHYTTINAAINRRMICLREILHIIELAYSRNTITIHPFNLDVLKWMA